MWVKLDSGFPDHPKINGIHPKAFVLWVCGLAYCNRLGKGGTIPKHMVKRVSWVSSRWAKVLVETGLWSEKSDVFVIHNYDKYQVTPERAAEIRKQKQEAGRKGGIASGEARRKQKEAPASEATKPDPSRSVPIRSVEGESDSDELKLDEIESMCHAKFGRVLAGADVVKIKKLTPIFRHELECALRTEGRSYGYVASVIETMRREEAKASPPPGKPAPKQKLTKKGAETVKAAGSNLKMYEGILNDG